MAAVFVSESWVVIYSHRLLSEPIAKLHQHETTVA